MCAKGHGTKTFYYETQGEINSRKTNELSKKKQTLEWRNIENLGFASISNDPVELDAVLSGLLGVYPLDVDYLMLTSETFVSWDEDTINTSIGRASNFSYLIG